MANRNIKNAANGTVGSPQLGEVGTVEWGVNRLRSDALVALLDDLVTLERVGLEEERCVVVRASLARVTNAATAIPDGAWWKTTVWKEFQRFEDLYRQWNDVNGTNPDSVKARAAMLRKLRDRRNRISRKIRHNQFILKNELDLQLVRDSYEALGTVAKAFPEVFKQLGAAIARFQSKSKLART
jgi:hypothetical protein